ncbi:hypothetical protein GW758_00750 [Candidatus Falkowbacteria bacterium]|nr:hypothetical protein [Candidatus Falkowbacteria bacterium]
MKKLIIASFIFFSLIPGLCLAQDTESSGRNLKNAFKEVQEEVGNNAGYNTKDDVSLEKMISKIINIVLSFIGIIFMILLILGGFNWMTAGGQEAKVQEASKTIKQAIIGLIVVLGSYAISYFIIKAFSFLAS